VLLNARAYFKTQSSALIPNRGDNHIQLSTMDGSESLTSNDMRQRIANLEEELRNAQAAKVEAEKNARKKAHRAHHVRLSFNSSPCWQPPSIVSDIVDETRHSYFDANFNLS